MQVLMLHNRYLIPGGEDQSTEAEVRLLRSVGHEVTLLEENNAKIAMIGKWRTAARTVWSRDAYKSVQELLRSKRFDVVHVQNSFPLLSPSVYYAAASEGVPVVQTLRNYRSACVNGLFFRENRICEECQGKLMLWPAIKHACYRDSAVGSAVVATMLTTHRLLRTYQSKVQLFIALTEFARQKFVNSGLPKDRIVVKPNFVDSQPEVGEGKGGYALYVGRLSAEKGLDTLLRAWKCVDRLPLRIAGSGPLEALVRDSATACNQIEFLGHKSASEVKTLMRDASCLVFPSGCYEGMPRSIIEAFAVGTPVLAANIGAASTMVQNMQTGLHFRPSDAGDLASKVHQFISNAGVAEEMRRNARAEYEAKYTPESNIGLLEQIYRQAQSALNHRKLYQHEPEQA